MDVQLLRQKYSIYFLYISSKRIVSVMISNVELNHDCSFPHFRPNSSIFNCNFNSSRYFLQWHGCFISEMDIELFATSIFLRWQLFRLSRYLLISQYQVTVICLSFEREGEREREREREGWKRDILNFSFHISVFILAIIQNAKL